MFDTYKEIFNQRGADYHQAMLDYPLARAQEFRLVLELAELQAEQTLCDVPSGGCYLQGFLATPVRTISIETSVEFIRRSSPWDESLPLLCAGLDDLPVLSGTVDCCVSVAGTHHLPHKPSFFGEVFRILRRGGRFCLADVRDGSGVAGFLNDFVDRHSTMGHRGLFLDGSTVRELEAEGFRIRADRCLPYAWIYPTEADMIRGCRLLFGIDRATDEEIRAGIESYLGFTTDSTGCALNWELRFIQAEKP